MGLTLCANHITFLTNIVQGAVSAAMAMDGHAFCNHESQALVAQLFPAVIEALREDGEEEPFPEEAEEQADAVSAATEGGE